MQQPLHKRTIEDVAATQGEHGQVLARIVQILEDHTTKLDAIETAITRLTAQVSHLARQVGGKQQPAGEE